MRHTISWLVTVASGSNTITVTLDGVAELLTIVAGDYRGWQTDAGGGADVGTLARALETALLTHSRAVTCEVSYDYSDPTGSPRLQVDITTTGPRTAGDGIVWTSADPLVWGWSGSATWGTATTVYADHNGDGYWCPGATGTEVVANERHMSLTAYRSRPDHNPASAAVSTRVWGSPRYRVALSYDLVPGAYVRPDLAENSLWAGAAGRDADDPNNLLWTMVLADVEGDRELRYHYDDGTTQDTGDGGGQWLAIHLTAWDTEAMAAKTGPGQYYAVTFGVEVES